MRRPARRTRPTEDGSSGAAQLLEGLLRLLGHFDGHVLHLSRRIALDLAGVYHEAAHFRERMANVDFRSTSLEAA